MKALPKRIIPNNASLTDNGKLNSIILRYY